MVTRVANDRTRGLKKKRLVPRIMANNVFFTVCALKRVLDNPTDMNKPVRGCHVIEGYLILIGNLGDTEEV